MAISWLSHGYLIEIKYISQKKFDDANSQATFEQKITDANIQLEKYGNDSRIQEMVEQVTLKKIALVYRGWALAYAEEVWGKIQQTEYSSVQLLEPLKPSLRLNKKKNYPKTHRLFLFSCGHTGYFIFLDGLTR